MEYQTSMSAEGTQLVLKADDNGAPRKRLTLTVNSQSDPPGSSSSSSGCAQVRLHKALVPVPGIGGDVKVFDAATLGNEIGFDANGDAYFSLDEFMPSKTVWLEGSAQSEAVGDITLELSVVDFCNCLLSNVSSTKLTVIWCEILLRSSGDVSSDDAVGVAYSQAQPDGFGTMALGAFVGSIPEKGQGGVIRVEVVGTVHPSDFATPLYPFVASPFQFIRTILSEALWLNGNLSPNSAPPGTDDTHAPAQDLDPQSGGSNGKIYDYDAPGRYWSTVNWPVVQGSGAITRQRVNFEEHITFEGIRCSRLMEWYSMVSIQAGTSPVLDTTFPNDNQAGEGSVGVYLESGDHDD